jgi:hypothetical protein
MPQTVGWLWQGVGMLACPSCPTAVAARDVFFTEDVGTRFAGMLAPFVVTLGLVTLLLSKLDRNDKRGKEARRDGR